MLLLDGLGALLTLLFLIGILVPFEAYFGMPKNVLYSLAIVAGLFAIYSLGSYFFLKKNWSPFLRGIAVANLLYCVATLGLVVYHFEKLTVLGVGYFLLEMVIIVVLVVVELRVSSRR